MLSAATARRESGRSAAADAPEGTPTADGHAALAQQSQPTTGDIANTQIQSAADGRLHKTTTGKLHSSLNISTVQSIELFFSSRERMSNNTIIIFGYNTGSGE